MRSSKTLHVVSCHAEGEVGDVIVGGVAPPPGDTLWEQSRYIARDGALRKFLLNEPRGGVFRHFNLLVPPKDPRAQMGFIIMEPEDTPPMSGSNAICVATVLLDTGILPMTEPQTRLTLEAPGGLIKIVADCHDGKARQITVQNVPSFVDRLDAPLEVAGFGALRVDIAYGGDSFVIVDAAALGFSIRSDEARDLAEAGVKIVAAANEQIGFTHPENAGWNHISFCQFAGPLTRADGALTGPNAVMVNRARSTARPPAPDAAPEWRCFTRAEKWGLEIGISRNRSSVRLSIAGLSGKPLSRGDPRSFRRFRAGLGSRGRTSTCWSRPTLGQRAIDWRIRGRSWGARAFS